MSLTAIKYKPAFIQGGKGRIFTFTCLAAPANDRKKGILLIPPFAEEMNKSRRMLMRQAKLLAAEGYTTLLPDLYGTGDSEGDFQDANWDIWCDDVVRARDLMFEYGVSSVDVVALRTGALLVSDLIARGRMDIEKLVLWQPVVSGDLYLNQFFRLRLAAEMDLDADSRVSIEEIRQELNHEGYTEIAGYDLSKDLAASIAEKQLSTMLEHYHGEMHWCEIIHAADRPLNAVSQGVFEKMSEAGMSARLYKIVGHPFWGAGAGVIEDVPGLLETTRRIFVE